MRKIKAYKENAGGKPYPLVSVIDGKDAPGKSFCSFGYTDKELLVFFRCFYEGRLKCPYKKSNSPVYRGDCVEVYIAVQDKPDEYFELDLAANNVLFSAKINGKNRALTLLDGKEIKTETKIYKEYFEAKITVPFAFLSDRKREDTRIRVNAFRVDCFTGERISYALFPTGQPTHHVPEAFGELSFEEDL